MTGHFDKALGTKASGAISGRPLSSCYKGNPLVHLVLLDYLRGLSFCIRREESKEKDAMSRY